MVVQIKTSVLLGIVMAASLMLATRATAATPREVDTAVDRAVAFLLKSQIGNNGVSWEDPEQAGRGFDGGVTACAVYALLAAGEKPQTNPKLAVAVDWLKKQDIKNTYAIAMRCQVWQMLGNVRDPEIREAMKRDGMTLLAGTANEKGKGYRGNWHYLPTQKDYDNSCSQYGVLGLWALEQRGMEVSDQLWKAIEQHWIDTQLPDGGWIYSERERPRLSMVAAGVASLFITQDYLHGTAGIRCSGNPANPPLAKGMKTLTETFSATKTVDLYTWYGIERIGVASGYKYLGTIDWYKMGSDALVKTQGKEGEWLFGIGMSVKSGKTPMSVRTVGTSLGTVFLTRGRAPVVINKLQYVIDGREANWNQRPRDVANAVKYMMRQSERDLNWQVVNLDVDVNELHDAPILFLSGNQTLNLRVSEEEKLRTFVLQGGLILGHADCSEPKFTKSFKELGAKLFKNYEFRKLPEDHPIYTRQQFPAKSWKSKPDLEGLSNGVRELMLLLPTGDPGKAWQLRDEKSKEEQFQLMCNVVLYTVEGRGLRFKGNGHLVQAERSAQTTLKMARLKAGDNWDPEPAGWKRLSATLTNSHAIAIEAIPVSVTDDALKTFKVAHLTGTTRFKLSADEQRALKTFIGRGGTLLVDAAGGNRDFAESAESTLRELFPDDARQLDAALPTNHPMYLATGVKLDEVSFRSFARNAIPAGIKTPLLRGITVNGRLAVIYSREDLSAGLVGEPVDGIIGYSATTALDLMSRVVVFASGVQPSAATKPSKH